MGWSGGAGSRSWSSSAGSSPLTVANARYLPLLLWGAEQILFTFLFSGSKVDSGLWGYAGSLLAPSTVPVPEHYWLWESNKFRVAGGCPLYYGIRGRSLACIGLKCDHCARAAPKSLVSGQWSASSHVPGEYAEL